MNKRKSCHTILILITQSSNQMTMSSELSLSSFEIFFMIPPYWPFQVLSAAGLSLSDHCDLKSQAAAWKNSSVEHFRSSDLPGGRSEGVATLSISAENFPFFVKFSAMKIFYNLDTAYPLIDITAKHVRLTFGERSTLFDRLEINTAFDKSKIIEF